MSGEGGSMSDDDVDIVGAVRDLSSVGEGLRDSLEPVLREREIDFGEIGAALDGIARSIGKLAESVDHVADGARGSCSR